MAMYMGAVELAWALADYIDECLQGAERHRIYVALGSGDPDCAIAGLALAAVDQRISLPRRLVHALQYWRAAHDDIDARLSTIISAVRIAPDPRRVASAEKANYRATTRDSLHGDTKPQTDGRS
jgi:hypothetical protein